MRVVGSVDAKPAIGFLWQTRATVMNPTMLAEEEEGGGERHEA
jgi:hypothetical protein